MRLLPSRTRGVPSTIFVFLLLLTPTAYACWFPGWCNIVNWVRNTVAPAITHAWHDVEHAVVHVADDVVHEVDTGWGDVKHWVVHAADTVAHDVVKGVDIAEHWVVHTADDVGKWVVSTIHKAGHFFVHEADEAYDWLKKEAAVVGDWLLKEAYTATVWVIQQVESAWQSLKGMIQGIAMLGKFVAMELEGLFEPAQVDQPIDDRTPPPLYDPDFPQYKNCTAGYKGSLDEQTIDTMTKDLTIIMHIMSKVEGQAYWNWMRCPGRVNITNGMLYNWYKLLTLDMQLFILGYSFNTTETFPAESNGDIVKPPGPFHSCDGIFYNFQDAVSCDFNNLLAWMKTITWADIWTAGKFVVTMVLDYFTLGVFSGVVDAVQDVEKHDWWGLVKDIATTVLFLVICL